MTGPFTFHIMNAYTGSRQAAEAAQRKFNESYFEVAKKLRAVDLARRALIAKHVGGSIAGGSITTITLDAEVISVNSEAVLDRLWLTVWGYYGQEPIPVERKETQANTYRIRVMKGRGTQVKSPPVVFDFKFDFTKIKERLANRPESKIIHY